VCNPGSTAGTTGVSYTVHFLALSGGTSAANTTANSDQLYTIKADLVGPAGPELTSITVGDGRLTLAWKAANDVTGYKFYCDSPSLQAAKPEQYGSPLIAVCAEGSTASGAGAGGASSTTETAGAGGVSAESAGAGGTEAAGAGGDAATTSGAAGETAATCSPSAYLIQGTVPKSGLECGSTGVAIQGTVKGLNNYEQVCVGVAAIDIVSNQGTLSEVRCGTPQQVYSFFQAYREAGGNAGGGYCSLTTRQRWRTDAWYVLPFAVALLSRRTGRSRRS